MAGFKEAIKDKAAKGKRKNGMKEAIIEQKLNTLFFKKRDPKGEVEFIDLLLNREGERGERYGLHASAMLASENEFCLREQVLSLFYKQIQGENIPVNLKRIFEEGNAIHEKWQRMFIRGGIGKPTNMDRSRFKKKYDLSYTPDAQIDILNCEDVPVEIKSMNTFAFQKATSHPSGEKQLNFYLCLLNKEWGFVLCEDKNTQNFKVFIVERDIEKAKPYLKRLKLIQKAKQTFLEERKMPPRKCKTCDCKRAEDCNMKDACFNIGMGRVKLKCNK